MPDPSLLKFEFDSFPNLFVLQDLIPAKNISNNYLEMTRRIASLIVPKPLFLHYPPSHSIAPFLIGSLLQIVKGDNEPIGIILSAEKDEVMVEYAMGGISNKIFVSKYQLYLPDKKLLQQKIKAIMYEK